MKSQLKNRIIASFLLLVFSLNTIAGFACSVGIDMGYNVHHHEHSKQVYKHGMLHSHGGANHNYKHYPQSAQTANLSSIAPNDDCCSKGVTQFALLDKSVANNNLHLDVPVILLAFATTSSTQNINDIGLAVNPKFQFVRRSSFLNDTDIQMAIRRFQI